MGIMDMFRAVAPAPPVPAAGTPGAGQPGNIPPNSATPATPNGGTVPGVAGVPAVPAVPDAPASPLDQFTDLWNTAPLTDAQKAAASNNVLAIDPQRIIAAAGKVDFAKVIKPEQLEAITKGGPEAAAAFVSAMNAVSQATYANSAIATTKIVEAALKQNQDKFDAALPGMLKKHNLSDSLRQENPALNHPAAAPILQALESQITIKYPNATSAEIKTMANSFLTSFASAATPATAAQIKASEGSGDFDWDKDFFSRQ